MKAVIVQIMDELRLNSITIHYLNEKLLRSLIKDDKMIVPKFGWKINLIKKKKNPFIDEANLVYLGDVIKIHPYTQDEAN